MVTRPILNNPKISYETTIIIKNYGKKNIDRKERVEIFMNLLCETLKF
jgi:hypothetical protein